MAATSGTLADATGSETSARRAVAALDCLESGAWTEAAYNARLTLRICRTGVFSSSL